MRDVSNTSLAVSCKHYLKTGNRSLRTIWHFIGTFELLNISQLDTLTILNPQKFYRANNRRPNGHCVFVCQIANDIQRFEGARLLKESTSKEIQFSG